MAAITPTLQNRIQSLDVLRGFAILMILVANIWAFGHVQLGTGPNMLVKDALTGWADAFQTAFVSGKFRGMLSFLFGVGLALQFNKGQRTGAWPGSYVKRTLLLLLLGCIHGLLIWYGDILTAYALTALVAMWFVKADDKTLILIASIMLAISLVFGLGLGFLGSFGPKGGDMGAADPAMTGIMAAFTEQGQVAAYQTGTYLDQVINRVGMFGAGLCLFFFFGPALLTSFLVGMIVGRRGILAAPSRHPEATKILSAVGFVGLFFNLLALPMHASETTFDFSMLVESGLNIPLSIGYAIWLAIAVEKGLFKPITAVLARVGTVALSVYLLTSVVSTAIFYSWGGALFAKLNYWQMLGVVPVVWVIVVAFALMWTKKFAMGPVEWLWRSASSGTKAPLTKAAALDATKGGIVPPPIAPPPAAQSYDPNRSSWPQ